MSFSLPGIEVGGTVVGATAAGSTAALVAGGGFVLVGAGLMIYGGYKVYQACHH